VPLAPLRPCWDKAFAWRSLGRSLPANAVRVQLGLGLAAGGGAASPSVLAPIFQKTPRARPLCRNQQ